MPKTTACQLICCTTTTASESDADLIAEKLLRFRLAACVQIDGPIKSHYRWNGEDHCDEEYRLTIKSDATVWPSLKAKLVELHPFDEPQVTMFAIDDTTSGYQRWVIDQVQQGE